MKDRRRFSETGDERSDQSESSQPEADAPHQHDPQDPIERGEHVGEPERDTQAHEPGDITFSSFAFGLASQALMLLGLAPDPASGAVEKDVAQAKGLIDILAMLQEKTRGNLDEDEARMMEEMLYELRMQFVRETRGHSAPKETT